MSEIGSLRLVLQFDEGLGHAVEFQCPELVERRMCQHRSSSSAMEVTGTTDVGMHYRRPVRGDCGTFGIEVALEDRVDGGVRACADLKRPAAGGLQPLPAVTLGQADDADRQPRSSDESSSGYGPAVR